MTKYMNAYRLLGVLLTIVVAACGENPVQVLPTDSPESARIKFFNFGVNAPGVNFYADDTKMTAILSATGSEATTGVTYGGVGNGGAYSQITPGTYTLTGRIAAATDKDLAIGSITNAPPDREIVAVIAYLQRLGTDIKASPSAATNLVATAKINP
jgi:hypothetical protein